MRTRWGVYVLLVMFLLALTGCKEDEVETNLELKDTMMFEHSVSTEVVGDDGEQTELVDDEGYIIKNDVVYVTANTVNIRKGPNVEAELVATVSYGTALNRTGRGADGWDRLFYEDQIAYVSNQYVTTVEIQEEREFEFSAALMSVVDTSRQIYSYDSMCEDLEELRAKYPDYMKINVLGTSRDNRSIFEVVLGADSAKKHVYISAGTCGAEYMSTLVCMKQLEYYLCFYETGNYNGFSYKDLFNNVAIHVVPMLNPDGVTISQEYLSCVKNEEIQDDLREWFERDQSSGGTSLSQDNYLMFFYANAYGVDVRLNFDYQWDKITGAEEPGSMSYKGAQAATEAETQALLYQLTRDNADLVINYHTSGAMVQYNYGQAEPLLGMTREYATQLATLMNYEVSDKLVGVDGYGSYEGYCNMVAGVPAMSVALGNGSTPLSLNEFDSIWNACRESWAAMQVAVIDY